MVGALLKSGVMLRTLSVSLLSVKHYGLVKVSVLLSVLYSQGEEFSSPMSAYSPIIYRTNNYNARIKSHYPHTQDYSDIC